MPLRVQGCCIAARCRCSEQRALEGLTHIHVACLALCSVQKTCTMSRDRQGMRTCAMASTWTASWHTNMSRHQSWSRGSAAHQQSAITSSGYARRSVRSETTSQRVDHLLIFKCSCCHSGTGACTASARDVHLHLPLVTLRNCIRCFRTEASAHRDGAPSDATMAQTAGQGPIRPACQGARGQIRQTGVQAEADAGLSCARSTAGRRHPLRPHHRARRSAMQHLQWDDNNMAAPILLLDH